MDDVDRAQQLEQAHLETALATHAAAPRKLLQTGQDCLACGDEIDPMRRAAVPGCALCLGCQENLERIHP